MQIKNKKNEEIRSIIEDDPEISSDDDSEKEEENFRRKLWVLYDHIPAILCEQFHLVKYSTFPFIK